MPYIRSTGSPCYTTAPYFTFANLYSLYLPQNNLYIYTIFGYTYGHVTGKFELCHHTVCMLWSSMLFTKLHDSILQCHVCLYLSVLVLESSSAIPSKCASTDVQQCNIVGIIRRAECVQHPTPKTPWSADHLTQDWVKKQSPKLDVEWAFPHLCSSTLGKEYDETLTTGLLLNTINFIIYIKCTFLWERGLECKPLFTLVYVKNIIFCGHYLRILGT